MAIKKVRTEQESGRDVYITEKLTSVDIVKIFNFQKIAFGGKNEYLEKLGDEAKSEMSDIMNKIADGYNGNSVAVISHVDQWVSGIEQHLRNGFGFVLMDSEANIDRISVPVEVGIPIKQTEVEAAETQES